MPSQANSALSTDERTAFLALNRLGRDSSLASIQSNTSQNTSESSIRYDTLLSGEQVIRRCGDCGSAKTSGHWCVDHLVQGGYICQKCYRRRRRVNTNVRVPTEIPTRRCEMCKNDQTMTVWYKHPTLENKYLCNKCTTTVDVSKISKCVGCGMSTFGKRKRDYCDKCEEQDSMDRINLKVKANAFNEGDLDYPRDYNAKGYDNKSDFSARDVGSKYAKEDDMDFKYFKESNEKDIMPFQPRGLDAKFLLTLNNPKDIGARFPSMLSIKSTEFENKDLMAPSPSPLYNLRAPESSPVGLKHASAPFHPILNREMRHPAPIIASNPSSATSAMFEPPTPATPMAMPEDLNLKLAPLGYSKGSAPVKLPGISEMLDNFSRIWRA